MRYFDFNSRATEVRGAATQADGPATAPIHRVFYEEHKARIMLFGELTESVVFDLCEEIDLAKRYYRYPVVELLIDSPGGSIAHLQYFLSRLEEWRRSPGFCLATVALTQAMSAAGIILALGDIGHRRAYPNARILLHDARIAPLRGMMIDKRGLARIGRMLDSLDRNTLACISRHIYHGKVCRETAVLGDEKTAYLHRKIPMFSRHGKQSWFHTSCPHLQERDLLRAYTKLQALDTPVPPEIALDSLLIDRIETANQNPL